MATTLEGEITATATPDTGRWTPRRIAIWAAVAILGAVAWGVLALARGESVNEVWLSVAALCSYAIAYRLHARFIATRVLRVDDNRATPAERLDNDQDFQPTDRRVLFGHHFAAIAGAGPLVGFFAQRDKYQQALDAGKVIPPAKSLDDVAQIVANSTVDGVLSILFAAQDRARQAELRAGDRG